MPAAERRKSGPSAGLYRYPVVVPCPECGRPREMKLTAAEERAAGPRRCWGCKVKHSRANFRLGIAARDNPAGRCPAEPTAAPRGSLAKMKVMRARLERGELLHHPGDSRETLAELPFEGLPPFSADPADPDLLAG